MRKITTLPSQTVLHIFLVLLIFQGWCTNALAQPLSGILPKYDRYVDGANVTLSWNSLSGATDYTIELAQNTDFTLNYFTSGAITETSWQTTLSSTGVWYWRVIESNGTSNTISGINKFRYVKPNDINGNTLWLKADSSVVLSGSSLVQWNDISGNNHSFVQSTPADQPLITNAGSILNNKPVVRFDGVSDFLNGGNILNIGTNSQTTFIVARGTGVYYGKFGNSAAPFNIYSCYNIGGEQGVEFAGLAYQNFATTNSTTYHLLNFRADRTAGTGRMYRNLNQVAEANLTGVTTGYNMTTTNPLLIGRYTLSGTPFFTNGDIAEVIFFNTALNDSLRGVVGNYLSDKYAPPINLGRDSIVISGFCPITLNAPSGYTNLLWSTGSNSASINVNTSGAYWLSGTNLFGQISVDTILITHPAIPSPTNTGICAGQSNTWNADMGPGFTYVWSNGATTPSIAITTPGTYSVTVFDGYGCSKNSGPFTFSIDNYEFSATLGNDTSLCTANLLALQVGASETVSYAWQGNAPSTQSTFPVGPTGNYWLESINVNGCLARDTIFITNVGTAPLAEFSVLAHCYNTVAPVNDQSSGVGSDFVAQWQWDMGNGTVLSGQNINYSYPLPGIYPVELYVQSVGGCGAYHYDTIEVFANPAAQFSFVGHCQNQEVQFSNASMQGGASLSAYSWDFGMPWTGSYNTSNIPIPNRIFEQVGSYDVKLVVTDLNGCKDSLTQTVQIDPSPQPNFVFQSTCQGTPIQFLNSSVTQPSSQYLWTFGDNTSSILVNPQHTYADYGINEVTLQVTNLYQCAAMSIQNVEVYALPLASMQLGAACVDSYLTLENSSSVPMGAVDSTMWIVNQTDTLYGAQSAWMVTALGQQQAELYTWSAQGCAAQTNQFFDVNEQFNASFSTGTGVVAVGQPFQFENTSNPGSIALWTFGDGAVSTEFSPEHTYSAAWEDETIDVMLIALNSSGCLDTSIQQVYIRQPRLDMEVTQLFLQQNGNWYTMGVRLKNVGTVDLATADFVVETNKGLLFNETWNGSLKPTEDSIYVFSAMPTSIFTDQDNIESYICLAGRAYDIYANAETALDNNTVCQNIEGTSIVLLPVFPNPVSSDFTVRIYVSQEAEVFLSLDDERGRTVRSLETGALLQPGYYDYPISSLSLSDGFYYLNLRAGDQKQAMKVSIIR